MKFQPLKNQKGILTLDFIFSLSLVMGLSVVLFALCITLAGIETAQYIAFSTSRTYYSAHLTEAKSRELAQQKFDSLRAKTGIRHLLNQMWFEITYLDSGDFSSNYEDVRGTKSPLIGSEIAIRSKVLNLRIPFFGTTSDGEGFPTKVNSYLGREPSASECIQFEMKRWEKIRQFNPNAQANVPTNIIPIFADNGC